MGTILSLKWKWIYFFILYLILDIDECIEFKDTQCYNNGTCVNTIGSYTCNCTLGWGGLKCETGKLFLSKISIAAREYFIIFYIHSYNYYFGFDFHYVTDVNECLVVPVTNGECINTAGSFLSLCKAGWTGERCEIGIIEICSCFC